MTKSPIPFRGFDDQALVEIYDHGVLPHWRQLGCTYFVTFRLADSIPKGVLQEIEYQRHLWLSARRIDPNGADWMKRLTQLSLAERRLFERHIGRLINESLDKCHGSCALRDPAIGNDVATALNFFDGIRVLTGDYVVMPNHVHVLLTPLGDFELEEILHSIKSYTANKINRALKQSGNFWRRESYDHVVRDSAQLEAYQQYIAATPSKAKLAAGEYILKKADYSFS
jgi:hypothetical protein